MGIVWLTTRVAVGVGVAVNVAEIKMPAGIGVAVELVGSVIERVAVIAEFVGVI